MSENTTGLQGWNDKGQNRESGGKTSEQAPYAVGAGEGGDPNPATGGE